MNAFIKSSALFLILLVSTAWAQSPVTDHTFKLDDGAQVGSGEISQMAWLQGNWQGEALGGQVDENWGAPLAGTMVGTMRVVKDGAVDMYEFMELSEKNNSLLLKVKHFDPQLNGWEEKNRFVEFRLIRIAGKRALFDGLTFEQTSADKVTVYVAMKKKDGTYDELTFNYTKKKLENVEVVAAESPTVDIQLPESNEKPVFYYDIRGGYRAPTPTGFEPTPTMQLFADGRLIVGRKSPKAGEVEYKFSEKEVRKFLDFVVNEMKIFEADTEAIKKEVEASGNANIVADAPTHFYEINLADRSHKVECYAVSILGNRLRKYDTMQHLKAIHHECLYLNARASLGPKENVDKIMSAISKEFKKRFPNIEPFSINDLKHASVNSEGQFQARFNRNEHMNGRPTGSYTGFIKKTGEKIEVNLSSMMAR